MIGQKDVLNWFGDPVLIDVTEGPDDPRDRPRRAYMLTFEPPEAIQNMMREQMIESGRLYIEMALAAGAELEDGVDLDSLDEVVEAEASRLDVSRMGVAEPFELCWN